jgi:hypothetical protein
VKCSVWPVEVCLGHLAMHSTCCYLVDFQLITQEHAGKTVLLSCAISHHECDLSTTKSSSHPVMGQNTFPGSMYYQRPYSTADQQSLTNRDKYPRDVLPQPFRDKKNWQAQHLEPRYCTNPSRRLMYCTELNFLTEILTIPQWQPISPAYLVLLFPRPPPCTRVNVVVV